MSLYDITVTVQLDDDIVVSTTYGCDIDIHIEVDTPIALEAFDWPPELDRISDRVKAIEDNLPPTIDIDSEVTETGTNPVEGKGIFAALQLLWQAVQQAFTDLFIPTKTSDLQNDSNFITSSSLTKANIEGLKDTDSPTFADTLIPALADPASYDPATAIT